MLPDIIILFVGEDFGGVGGGTGTMEKKGNGKWICYGCMSELEQEGVCPVCGFDIGSYVPETHYLSLGTVLNTRYVVGRVLGEGGFGITYMGWDNSLEIRVAIKEYYPSGLVTRELNEENRGTVSVYMGNKQKDYETGLSKFLDETRRLAKFRNNPGIVGVSDFFEENKTAYMVMDYVDGITLSAYMKEKGGRIPAAQAVEMLSPVIRSLEEIHKENIIHRDISPDNVMVQKNGTVRLIDFGAARDFSEKNKSLSVVLKPGYAPEEQYRTKGVQGPWTDVYALCATLYKMITGITPEESMERIVGAGLKKPSELGIEIPQNVEKTILRGMEVKAEKRIRSMADLLRSLSGEELKEELHFESGNKAEVGQKTEYIENNVDFEQIQKNRVRSYSLGKKRMKKAGVFAMAVFAVAIIAIVFRIGSDQSGGAGDETTEAQETPVPTLSPEEENYIKADQYSKQGEFDKAAGIYETIAYYKDAGEKRRECIYQMALQSYQGEKYEEAMGMLNEVERQQQEEELYQKCSMELKKQKDYQEAEKLYKEGQYQESKKILKNLPDYNPAIKLLKKVNVKIKNMPPDAPDVGEFYDSTNYSAGGDGTMWTVEWKPVKGADGYQYSVIEDDNPPIGNVPYYAEQDTTECFYETGASNSIKVEFKVRAYKYINGTKKYGEWSRTVYCYMN